jgi:type IV pilus assembly protein PilY1
MQRSIGRFLARRWAPLGACAFAATLFLPRNADAQSLGAANVPLPNVLLLLDTSGSFENMIDGNTPETAGENGTCVPGSASIPNRWGTAVQALTGSIQPYYSCASMNRSSTGFFNQYAISTSGGVGGLKAPYDTGYYLPFHRPISVDSTSGTAVNCMYTPNALPGAAGGGVGNGPTGAPSATSSTDCSGTACTALDFPADAIGTYAYFTTGAFPGQTVNQAANVCTFSQSSNGAIDASASLMRFGLMTFDNDPDPGIGVTYGTLPSLFPANTTSSAFEGQWSYFHGWNSGTPTRCPGAYVPCVETGFPAGCTISPAPFFEVGARNPAAPPWEGRLMTFPGQGADTIATIESNQNVQLAIDAMRPYGATPIAGMFDDAEEYLWNDPTGPQVTDQFVSGGCRAEYVILLTDGQPNQDLEPQCAAAGGKCPYQTAYQTALSLYNGTDPVTGRAGQKVTTYVIGFAVSQNISPLIANCAALAKSTGGYATYCPSAQPTDPQYPCCQLQQIAAAGQGGTGQAYFADTPGDLNAALGAILGQIASQITSQTLPVYSPTVSYTGGAGSSAEFLTTFSGAQVPWSGDVLRQELVCTGTPLAAQPQTITPANGDDFLADMQAGTPASRQFMAFKMPTTGDTSGVDPGLTIRPYLSLTPETTDGLASFGSTGSEIGMSQASINNTNFPATTLNTTAASCEDPTTHVFLSAADCANVALQFAMAQPTVSTSSSTFNATFASTTSRCPASGKCEPLGAILHSTPNLTVPPNAILRDDSYQAFATSLSPAALNPPRNPTLFVATTDGLLHAFDTTVTTKVNNELWSFIPPGVMPNLLSNYPSANAILLDGAPIVKDVVWQRTLGGTSTAWQSAWHTMLVAGFGAGGRGYYALDVTDPRNTGSNFKAISNFTSFPPAGVLSGPHFQWQIASVNPPGGPYNNNEIFGTTSATPAITTVYADPVNAGAFPSEIGVAILPGGSSGPPVSAVPCTRDLFASAGTYSPVTTYNTSDPLFAPRQQVRRWAKNCIGTGSGVPGRSITVVRMDTGDILAVFGRPSTSSPDLPTNLNVNRIIKAPFDSPMTGTPVVYPPDVGAIAQQVFVGDADGTMWRLDLTNANPALWTASLFFDSYNGVADQTYNLTDTNHLADDSEAIAITPITTIDSQGNLTLQYATGDQSSYTANYTVPGSPNKPLEEINFVYSLKVGSTTAGAVQSQLNWYLPFRYGERVTGPMAVFDNTFYFASFAPPNPSAGGVLCGSGTPKLWGLDFELPVSTCSVPPSDWQGIPTGCGGNPRDFLPNGVLPDPPAADGTSTANIVIPGVAIAVTPSCTNTSVPAADQYTGGMHTTASGSTSGTYSLVAQIGVKGGTGGAPNTVPHALLAPNSTTLVDSWATLAE